MSKYIPGNQKHLTLEDRKYIEKSLNAGCSFKDIAMPESKMFYGKLMSLQQFYKDLASHNSKKSKNFKAWWNLPLHWNLLFQVSKQ